MGKNAGCRKVADTCNRVHAPVRVGKSFVSDTIRNHQYALLNITRELRDQRPAPVNVNRVWGVDLTFVQDHRSMPRPAPFWASSITVPASALGWQRWSTSAHGR